MPIRRAIVVGLDGLDPEIVESMLAAGQLPHLARLRQLGGYSRLATTYPAQTPVAWSTFATGLNPGGHGIFDFVARDPATYQPRMALNHFVRPVPFLPPKVVNGRRAIPVWSRLSQAGVASTVIRCPCTFPPDEIEGRVLSGMGVPDLRGGFGTSTFYSTAGTLHAGESEIVKHISIGPGDKVQTSLIGPRDPQTLKDVEFPVTFQVDRAKRKITAVSSGEPAALEVKLGQWSNWLRVKFKLGLLTAMRGMVRFHLVRLEPNVEIYVSPVNFDPQAPPYPISAPASYARELASAVGTFYTTGMVEDHNGLDNGRIDEAAYLNQCQQVMDERRRMMLHELARGNTGFFFVLYDTPDRLQHMFWRYREPAHPANVGRDAKEWSHAIEEHYRQCDAIVGDALAHADESTLVIVLSDHGFGSFQRGVNLNTWLYEQGLLSLKAGVQPGPETSEFFHGVDWTRTKAYSLGLGGIYLNLQGREKQGMVSTDEAASLRSAIADQLAGLRDPQRDAVGIRGAVVRDQIYRGPFVQEAPDVLVNFARGYRASWCTTLGGLASETWEDNTKRWSGDHIVDPAIVPGVLFMNRPFKDSHPRLLDLAPTLLAALEAPRDPAMEGESLLP